MTFGLDGVPGSQAAAIEPASERTLTYGELRDKVAQSAKRLAARYGGGFLAHFAANTTDAAIAYLAALEAKVPLILLDPTRPQDGVKVLKAYRPAAVLLPPDGAVPEGYREVGALEGLTYRLAEDGGAERPALHPDLALLLTTSGSTGSPKLVRLTRRNLEANAAAIAAYLELTPEERPVLSLPVYYSYGLSVLNSHLAAGASFVLTRHSFLQGDFWREVAATSCTSFAGVPYMYETMHRLRFDPARYAALRTYTQAGGGLRKDLIEHFHERIHGVSARFFVMYGQTEATARISYVPPARLGEKAGSIGIAVPHGKLSLEPVEDWSEVRELVYTGPNVMMGYAEGPEDLAKGDEQGGALRTGDLAYADDEGFYFLSGRLKRFAKLFGRRVSLADIEQDVERDYGCRAIAVEREGGLALFVESARALDTVMVSQALAASLGVPPRSVTVTQIEKLPRTANGKKDYKALS